MWDKRGMRIIYSSHSRSKVEGFLQPSLTIWTLPTEQYHTPILQPYSYHQTYLSVKFLLLPHPHPEDGHYTLHWNTGTYFTAKPQKPRLHNITMDLREIDFNDVWIHLAQGSNAGSQPPHSIRTMNFFGSWVTTAVIRKTLLHTDSESGSTSTTSISIYKIRQLSWRTEYSEYIKYYVTASDTVLPMASPRYVRQCLVCACWDGPPTLPSVQYHRSVAHTSLGDWTFGTAVSLGGHGNPPQISYTWQVAPYLSQNYPKKRGNNVQSSKRIIIASRMFHPWTVFLYISLSMNITFNSLCACKIKGHKTNWTNIWPEKTKSRWNVHGISDWDTQKHGDDVKLWGYIWQI